MVITNGVDPTVLHPVITMSMDNMDPAEPANQLPNAIRNVIQNMLRNTPVIKYIQSVHTKYQIMRNQSRRIYSLMDQLKYINYIKLGCIHCI